MMFVLLAVLLSGGNGGFGGTPQNSQSDGDSSNTTVSYK